MSLGSIDGINVVTDQSNRAGDVSPGGKLPTSIGRYRVLGRIGHGGMATVYLGQSDGPQGFERLVAIKLLHEHLAVEKRVVEMFMEEARVAARIRHPNVVPVIEVGQSEGRYFLVMEYIHGESLLTVIARSYRQNQNFSPHYAAFLLTGASDGLHAAHELTAPNGRPLEVVHRDVSPHNFLVGYDGVIRISDFGIVKVSNEIAHTQSGVKGKVAYMAPEQALGKAVDRRTDLFALGIVMWEMLCGRRLFKASTDFNTLQNVCTRKIPPPSTCQSDVPKELDTITLRLLQRQPENRYGTALEVSQELRGFLVAQGVSLFANDIATFMSETCTDRMNLKLEMERKFQDSEQYDAEELFRESSRDNLLETVEENLEDGTPSQTAAKLLRDELKQRFIDPSGEFTGEDSASSDDGSSFDRTVADWSSIAQSAVDDEKSYDKTRKVPSPMPLSGQASSQPVLEPEYSRPFMEGVDNTRGEIPSGADWLEASSGSVQGLRRKKLLWSCALILVIGLVGAWGLQDVAQPIEPTVLKSGVEAQIVESKEDKAKLEPKLEPTPVVGADLIEVENETSTASAEIVIIKNEPKKSHSKELKREKPKSKEGFQPKKREPRRRTKKKIKPKNTLFSGDDL